MSDSGYKIRDQYSTYFITLTVVGWVDLFTRKECKEILIASLKYCQSNKGLIIHGYVIMSSHIHLIVTASEGSAGLSNIIRDMKTFTAKELLKWVLESGMESRKEWLEIVFAYHAKYNSNNTKYQIWKQDNRPKQCLHPKFTLQKLNYVHYNPVESGIVGEPEHYKYSSAAQYLGIENGIIDIEIIDFGLQEGYVAM